MLDQLEDKINAEDYPRYHILTLNRNYTNNYTNCVYTDVRINCILTDDDVNSAWGASYENPSHRKCYLALRNPTQINQYDDNRFDWNAIQNYTVATCLNHIKEKGIILGDLNVPYESYIGEYAHLTGFGRW